MTVFYVTFSIVIYLALCSILGYYSANFKSRKYRDPKPSIGEIVDSTFEFVILSIPAVPVLILFIYIVI